MKTVTLPEEFVLNAHKAACDDWKKKIEKQLPELFKDLYKIGDRFIMTDGFYKGHEYILAECGTSQPSLIDLSSGEKWSDSALVKDRLNITKEEFEKITNNKGFRFKKIGSLP